MADFESINLPRLLRAKDAARYCSVSNSLWSEMVKTGAAPTPINVGDRVKRWDRKALDTWIDTLGRPGFDNFARVE